jgi:hypothetical protein
MMYDRGYATFARELSRREEQRKNNCRNGEHEWEDDPDAPGVQRCAGRNAYGPFQCDAVRMKPMNRAQRRKRSAL